MIKKQFPQFVPGIMKSEQQLEWMYMDQNKTLITYASTILGDMEAGKEVVQELFAKLLEKKERFENYQHAVGMLKVATKNKCADAYRHKKSRETEHKRFLDANGADLVESLLLEDVEEDGVMEIVEKLGGLAHYLQQIPSPYREAIVGKIIEQKSYPEICEELQVQVTAARNYVLKAKKMIRGLLDQSGVKFPLLSIAMITLCRIIVAIILIILIPITIL